jgi:transcriptional regulator with XRE-family HTH domain
MDLRDFGPRLRRAREQRRLSMPQLAGQIGIDYMQIYRYEKGLSFPSFATAVRLADIFQISLDVLAGGGEIPEAPPSFRSSSLLERMRQLDALPPERQQLALRILDALLAGDLDGLARRLPQTAPTV